MDIQVRKQISQTTGDISPPNNEAVAPFSPVSIFSYMDGWLESMVDVGKYTKNIWAKV